MSGAGNDFVLIDARDRKLDFENLAKSLCAQYDADGFVAFDRSERADARLHFYNRDGLRGELCGNGTRCACHLARLLGFQKELLTFETDAGLVQTEYLGNDQYRMQLPLPSVWEKSLRPDALYYEVGYPGLPHCYTQIPDLDYSQREQLRNYAKEIRHDPVFPKGVNVNFYRMLDKNRARLLTYERGVEDYTLACGTGSACLAVLLWQQGWLTDGPLEVENPGGTLTIELAHDHRLQTIYLSGPATLLNTYDIPN